MSDNPQRDAEGGNPQDAGAPRWPTMRLRHRGWRRVRLVAGLLVALACAMLILHTSWNGRGGAGKPGEGPASPAGGPLSPEPWPMYRGSAACTGVAESPLPDALTKLWTYDAGAGVRSTAAIVDGTVFVGTDANEVLALDLASGRKRWSYKTEGRVSASPCVVGGRVFVGDEAGTFLCLDAATGRRLWQFQINGQIWSSATAVGDAILFGCYDYYLYCLSAADGGLRWKFQSGKQVHCAPAVLGGRAIIGGCDGFLQVVSLSDGQGQEETELGAIISATPAAVAPSAPGPPPGLIYVPTMSGSVYCVSLGVRGEQPWQWKRDFPDVAFYASAAVAPASPRAAPGEGGGRVIVAGRDGRVRCLDAADGHDLWQFQAKGDCDSSPVVVGSRVVFGSSDGNVYLLNLADGSLVWSFTGGGAFSASPAVGQGRLVIANEDGTIYCFGAKPQAARG